MVMSGFACKMITATEIYSAHPKVAVEPPLRYALRGLALERGRSAVARKGGFNGWS